MKIVYKIKKAFLVEWLKKTGDSVQELSNKCDVSMASLYRLFRGGGVSGKIAKKIATSIEKNISEIFDSEIDI